MEQETSVQKPVQEVKERTTMSFIIGKLWLTSQDGTKPGAIRISNTLPKNIILTKGSSLFLNANEKRPGKTDADFSVSVVLPKEKAQELIAMEKLATSGISVGVIE